MIRILYDLSYATRGASGIPGDCRSVGRILSSSEQLETSFVIFPKSYVPKHVISSVKIPIYANYIGSSLRRQSTRSALPVKLERMLLLIQATSRLRKIGMIRVEDPIRKRALIQLGIPETNIKKISKLYIPRISVPARFIRPLRNRMYKLKIRDFDFYIQQQIDPISIPRGIKHVVRLHDILPMTHPELFDDIAIRAFSKGLMGLLKNKNIIWVLDSESAAEEFTKLFNRKSFCIPCEVGSHFENDFKVGEKKNQIVMVNTIEPRKQVRFAIETFLEAKRENLITSINKLIIIGSQGWIESQLWDDLIESKFGPDIEFIPDASVSTVRAKVAESKYVLSASLAEGFGLPPLEGMLLGSKPILSSIPQHHETVRDFGIYFDPTSSSSLRQALIVADQYCSKFEVNHEAINHVRSEFGPERIRLMWIELLTSVREFS